MNDKWVLLRRQMILDAAAELFAEKGFHQTTVRDIATAAGMADGTIYNYFDNKHAILIALFEQLRTAVSDDVQWQDLPPGDVDGWLQRLIEHPLRVFGEDQQALFRIVLSEMMVDDTLRTLYQTEILQPTLALAEPVLQRWVDNGDIKPIDVPLTVRIISGSLTGLTLLRLMGDSVTNEKWATLPPLLTDILINGLRQNG